MRAKRLGRTELLRWVNTITSCDYPKIENFSDGIGLCQVIDAFFNNVTPEIMKLKLNSKNKDDWVTNLNILNDMLLKQKSLKQVDPNKLSKCNFSVNFEFVQFLYDFIMKTFNTATPKRYNGFQRRLQIVKSQYGEKALSDIKRYLPSHLLTNELLLQMDKEKYFGEPSLVSSRIISQSLDNETENSNIESIEENVELNNKIKKYNKYLNMLEDDLKRLVSLNKAMEEEINGYKGECDYYIGKMQIILNYCERKKKKGNSKDSQILTDIINLITTVPEEFQAQ